MTSVTQKSAGLKRDGKSAGVKRDASADASAGIERVVSAGVERKASADASAGVERQATADVGPDTSAGVERKASADDKHEDALASSLKQARASELRYV